MTTYVQVITTVDKEEIVHLIAKLMVEQRLAACAQIIGPISSTFWWNGEIETSEEWLCVLKSRQDLAGPLEQAIREVHPYETPEIVVVPIVAGSKEYLAWMAGELRG